ncbi:hypothetical protein [Actinacidiphila glaucinigra]|uniref:hypothetical protein n=1 Tax=Actinacidiphila glaucinigra TaxID=235986 RepID=UPI002E35ABA6|nr:hypothetical protein [Actinacidiphila glaucinigra]
MDGVFRRGAAIPAALPFVIRLAVCPEVPVRSGLTGLVVVAAELAEPVDPENEHAVRLRGLDADHPERALCRAVLAAHAALVCAR